MRLKMLGTGALFTKSLGGRNAPVPMCLEQTSKDIASFIRCRGGDFAHSGGGTE
jgi:hypothetical protein